MLVWSFGLLLLLIFFAIPIGFAIGITSLIMMQGLGLPPSLAITQLFTGLDSFTLMAIPFFILAGDIMGEAGIVTSFVNFANLLVGRLRGGLGHVDIVSCMIISGVSGSGVADCSAIGSMLIPAMKKHGYHMDFAVVVTCCAATVGPIIPPSIPMVVWGVVTSESIGELFLGGVIPGILVGLALMAMNYLVCLKRGYDFRGELARPKGKVTVMAIVETVGALIMPLIIVGGIVFGAFTATEAGVVAVLYGVAFGVFVTKALKFRMIPKILINSATTTALVMLIVGMAMVFSNVLVRLQFQTVVINTIKSMASTPTMVTLLVMAFLLFLGCFIDTTVMVIMLGPTLAKLGNELGYDPIHYGVFILMVMIIGAVTPPVGSMLFVACSIGRLPIEKTLGLLYPFVAVLIAVTLLVLFVPELVLWVPSLFFKTTG